MKITDGAKQLLENFLTEKGAEGIRLSSVAGMLRITIYDEFSCTTRSLIRLKPLTEFR